MKTYPQTPLRPAQRVFIVGAPGSGKTWLGRQYATRLNVPLCELDDIYWMNETGSYGIKRPADQRDAQLQEILSRPTWVIEGIYYKWLAPVMAQADCIIILTPPEWLRNWRLLKRHLLRADSRQQNWKQFWQLYNWGRDFNHTTLPAILEMTQPYADKRHIAR